MGIDFNIEIIEGFDWDRGNTEKNWIKHRVSKEECEEVFFNKPLRIQVYSKTEKRFGALGRSNTGRRLTIIFTIRDSAIRLISARDQGKKDRKIYESLVPR